MGRHLSSRELQEKYGYKEVKCLVCGKIGPRHQISRHIMNSRSEPSHAKFIKEQDKIIKNLYHTLPIEDLEPKIVAYMENIFCSPSYVRKIFSSFSDYKEKCKEKRSINTSKQYKNGNRKISIPIGWKPKTRSDYGKRGVSVEKLERILELFNADLQIKEISKETGSKHETIVNIWKEFFDKDKIKKRLNRTWNKYKPTIEQEQEILLLFNTDLSNNDICKKFNTYNIHVANIFIKYYGKTAYNIRKEKMKKLGILKSLKVTGEMGTTGSRPENLCYELLKKELGGKVIHHDFDTLPPFEIDITIPSKKIAICWDGPFHRKPIFGQNRLENVQLRDNRKHSELIKMDWKVIVVEDNNKKLIPVFVEQKVQDILKLIERGFVNKVIVR